MEISSIPPLTTDIRQSAEWSDYLSIYGWKTYTTNNNIKCYLSKQVLARIAKVQRPESLTKEDIAEIESLSKKNKAALLKIEPKTEEQEKNLQEAGFSKSYAHLSPPATSVIDLNHSGKALWNNLSSSARYSINRAKREKNYVEFYLHPKEPELKKFYKLEEETAKLKKFNIHSYKDLLNRASVFKEKAILALTYDERKNLCGGKFYLGHNKRIWYMHGGTSNIGRKNKSGYLLVWESLLYFKSLGYHMLDFEGIYDKRFPETKGWSGTTHFKEKFGGQIILFPHPRVKYYNQALKLLARFSPFTI